MSISHVQSRAPRTIHSMEPPTTMILPKNADDFFLHAVNGFDPIDLKSVLYNLYQDDDESFHPDSPDKETLQYLRQCGTAKQIVVYYVTVLKRRPRMFS